MLAHLIRRILVGVMKEGENRDITKEKHRFEDGITIKAKEVSKTGSEVHTSDGKTDFLLIAKK